jgi:hypothetical protein
MDDLPQIRIREAVASGEFKRAQDLWDAYIMQLEVELRHGSLSATKLAQVRDLMDWSRGVALCARLHAQDRLNSLLIAAEYGNPPSSTISGPDTQSAAPRLVSALF